MSMPVRHVILVTYGEPPQPSFTEQLSYSWRILLGLTRTVAPIPKPLLPLIALSRAHTRYRAWTGEKYSSPLEPITARQADELWIALTAADPACEWRVRAAYEFRQPLLSEVLGAIPANEPVYLVPMYATDSDFTHGLSRLTAREFAHSRTYEGAITVLPALDTGRLASICVEHIRQSLAERSGWSGDDVALVLAAHGTIVEPAESIDNGLEVTEALCKAIRASLADDFGLIVNGWLNHTRGGRWTDPPIDQALRQVRAAGITRVVYFPYGFLADNAESQLEGRVALRSQPELEPLHLPCLNESQLLVRALAEQVIEQDSSVIAAAS